MTIKLPFFYYHRQWDWYYGNGQSGDFKYPTNVLCIGPWQWWWHQ